MRVTDGAGNVALVAGPAGIVVDTTPPSLTLHPLAEGWVNRAEIDLTASDNLHGILGLGAIEIDVNAAADGADTGEWTRRSTTAGVAGRRTLPIDLRGLIEGRHVVRVRVRNGGPAGARLLAEARGALRVDLTSPVIASASFTGGGAAPLVASWVADDATSGVATATIQWRQGSGWRTLAREAARNGAGRRPARRLGAAQRGAGPARGDHRRGRQRRGPHRRRRGGRPRRGRRARPGPVGTPHAWPSRARAASAAAAGSCWCGAWTRASASGSSAT